MYKAPKNGKRSDSYRTESLINGDKQGRRDDGQAKSKKTNTRMALVKGQCCTFKVVVKWDENGFYIDTKSSVPFHKYHPRSSIESMHIPTRLIPNEERENLIALAESCVGAGLEGIFYIASLASIYRMLKLPIFKTRHRKSLFILC